MVTLVNKNRERIVKLKVDRAVLKQRKPAVGKESERETVSQASRSGVMKELLLVRLLV